MDLGLKGKAALVAFLASEQSGYITGAAIQIDGGWYKGIM
jgi:3-oxoacyl-[acyl-carrier protein] reductase